MQGFDYQGFAILVAAFAAAFVSIGTFIRAGRTDRRIDKLEVNTNSIKDALIHSTAQEAFARGGQAERDKQASVSGARDSATIAERSRSDEALKKN